MIIYALIIEDTKGNYHRMAINLSPASLYSVQQLHPTLLNQTYHSSPLQFNVSPPFQCRSGTVIGSAKNK